MVEKGLPAIFDLSLQGLNSKLLPQLCHCCQGSEHCPRPQPPSPAAMAPPAKEVKEGLLQEELGPGACDRAVGEGGEPCQSHPQEPSSLTPVITHGSLDTISPW